MKVFKVVFKISNSDKPLEVLWVAENEHIATQTAIEKMNEMYEMYKFSTTFKHIKTTVSK